MLDEINRIANEAENFKIEKQKDIEEFKQKFSSQVKNLFEHFKTLAVDDKKIVGPAINKLKGEIDSIYKKAVITLANGKEESKEVDYSLQFANENQIGNRHPLSLVKEKIINILGKIGFTLADGPEIEDDWHNFTALNVPQDHPARDMQDTFFLDENFSTVLRTHTSGVQIRVLENCQLPVRIISAGRVYRNEDISYRSHCMFHQVEGLYVDKNVSFVDLKQTINYIFKNLFGENVQLRYRPSYFPFTEPSTEIDVSCFICGGKGCNVCKHNGWLEVCGAGMIDPNVLINTNIDPDTYSGLAFGFGIERLAMLLYQVGDIRFFSTNDVRFLKQFNLI
ncbi:MAG: phenylalanine--tRNA ligase subunit alpha [Cytophagales bacterium]|nr:phenylalanine--tRNA ligase subunit alpha [Cytophagales bacterium]